ncbi:MAG: PIN domain-containing protein [Euryarchaeota archaeon]|nr:PIN domain-containing protein [Euryarchaeota archaeon]
MSRYSSTHGRGWLWPTRRMHTTNSPPESTKRYRRGDTELVTSDCVLDETITILFRNVTFTSATRFIDSLLRAVDARQISVERITASRFKSAWSLRKQYQDKPRISFTDITSFVVMQEREIGTVFTGDTDFEKIDLGVTLLPTIH